MPPGSRRPLDVQVDPGDLRALMRDLKELEGGKPIAAALRKGLRKAADPIKRQVQGNASWSSRIPGAVSIGTAFSARRTGVFLRVNAAKAPHARAYENDGKPGTFRHPVFGSNTWVAQAARPFFFAETQRHLPEVEQAAATAVDEAARSAGFR